MTKATFTLQSPVPHGTREQAELRSTCRLDWAHEPPSEGPAGSKVRRFEQADRFSLGAAELASEPAALKEVKERIAQQGEHRPPAIVAKALAAIAKTVRAEMRKLDASIAAKIKANPAFARRAEIIRSFPGLADQAIAGLIARLPELGHVTDEAAAR